MSSPVIFAWEPRGDKLVAQVLDFEVTLEKIDTRWQATVMCRTARVAIVSGKKQDSVMKVARKRLFAAREALLDEQCAACDGPLFVHQSGKLRCLTRGCEHYKK